jgi:diguanylate cyclase (GGDEF)-like protein/PAS domain S-box-containing protein
VNHSTDSEAYLSLYLALFENANDPQYILDDAQERFLKVNAAFEKLTGYSREEFESGQVSPDDLDVPGSPRIGNGPEEVRPEYTAPDRYEYSLFTKTGEVKTLEVSAKRMKVDGRWLTLGSVRDISRRKELEGRLKEEIGIQKTKTIEATKASVRIYQLTEKIRNAPRLTNALLRVENVDQLLEDSATLMCDKGCLNYGGVVFYLIQDGKLVRRFACRQSGEAIFDLAKSRSRFARVARGEEPLIRTSGGQLIVPIQTRRDIIGVLGVRFDSGERVLFDDNETVRQGQEDIIKTVASSIGVMIDNLRLLETIRQQSIEDQLTGVFNRRYFDRKLREEFRRAKRYDRDLALLMVDLDFFKSVNDNYGHPQGDRILADVADIFRSESREADVICRYGGDEFILLLPETDLPAARNKAERLRSIVETTPFENISGKGGEPLRLTLSIGVSAVSGNVPDEAGFLKMTDDALYAAKRGGRNQIHVPSDL